MSSLLKYTRVISKQEDTRIIDSNERVAAKLAELAAVSNYIKEEDDDNEFVRGISAEHVEMLLEEDSTEQEVLPEELIEEAKTKADEILGQAEAEKVFLFEEAKREGLQKGYQEGYQKAFGEFEEQKKALQREKEAVVQEYEQRLDEMEPVLVDTIVDILQTVLSVDLSQRRDMVLLLVKNCLTQIERSRDYTIRVSADDYETIRAGQDEIKQIFSDDVQISIVEDASLKAGQSMIETDRGIFDCSLDTQLESLVKTIKILSRT